MISEKVKNYVKKSLSKGFSKNAIQLKLLDAGVKIEDINKAFEEVGQQGVVEKDLEPMEKEETKHKEINNDSNDINDLFDDLEAKAQKLTASNRSYDDDKKAVLSRFIKQELKKGVHPRKVYFLLIRQRHDPETIKKLIEEITSNQDNQEIKLAPPTNEPQTTQLSINKNIILYSLIAILIIGGLVVAFFLLINNIECVEDNDCKDISDTAFCLGLPEKKPICLEAKQTIVDVSKNLIIKEKESFLITTNKGEVILHLDRFESNKAKIIVHPENKELSLGPGDSERLDISKDGKEDLYIELKHFQENGAMLFFDEITPLVNIIVKTPKENYEVGEPFLATVSIEIEADNFDAVVRYTKQKQGSEEKLQYIIKGNTNENIIKNRELLAIETKNGFLTNKESFSAPGTYIYSLEVYSCDDLQEDANCESLTITELDSALPLIKQQKAINVI